MKTTKEAVIKATSDLADEKGLNNVSLKAVAQKLNIRTPSLYNHIESLDNLLLEVAHNGMRDMNERMMKIAVGKIGKEEIIQTLKSVRLDPYSKLHVGKYSMGMKQRLGIAQAIMEKPEILILDEPMNGLDNDGVMEMRKLFINLREEGTMIIIASHNKEDIEVLCDEVFEMEKGKLTPVQH